MNENDEISLNGSGETEEDFQVNPSKFQGELKEEFQVNPSKFPGEIKDISRQNDLLFQVNEDIFTGERSFPSTSTSGARSPTLSSFPSRVIGLPFIVTIPDRSSMLTPL